MDSEHARELRRNQWRSLLLGGYEAQVAGYPTSITVSKRFDDSLSEGELDSLASMALRLAEEYELAATLTREGRSLCLRVSSRSEERTAPLEVAPMPAQEAQLDRASLRQRILRLVEGPARMAARE
jgi:hypothetical protein